MTDRILLDTQRVRAHKPGTCFGCGTKMEAGSGSWCLERPECEPQDPSRERMLAERGLLDNQRIVPTGDEHALAAVMALFRTSITLDRERRERNEERPVAWIINIIRCEDGQTIVSLDCDGHADKSTVSRGTAVEWEPIPGVPVYERRGPPSTSLLCTDSEPNTPPPSIVERLAEGFAMIDGYESYRHRIGELRGQHGWSPRP